MEVVCNSIRAIDFLSLYTHHMAKIIKRPQINNKKMNKKQQTEVPIATDRKLKEKENNKEDIWNYGGQSGRKEDLMLKKTSNRNLNK